MTNPKSRMYAAVAGALSMGAAVAWAAEPTPTDLKVQELEAKVAQLESRQAANSKDMAATIDAVLRDAEKRSQLLANGGDQGAGYDGGFYIKAGDNWVLRPGVLFQFWNVTDWRQNVPDATSTKDMLDNGFEVHNLWLQLEGTAFTKDLTYSFIWDTASEGGTMSLLDAWAKYMFSDDWGVRVGQFKDPVSHEYLTYEGYLMAAGRSLQDQLFGAGIFNRVQGASLIYGNYSPKNPINAEVAFTDGPSSINTNFTKNENGVLSAHDFDFGVAGRVEYKAMGNWKDYRDFTAMGDKEDLLVFGLGGDWSQSGSSNVYTGALDVDWENTSGLAIFGSGMVRHTEARMVQQVASALTGIANPDVEHETDWSLLGQVSYLLNPSWEVFGRVDWNHADRSIPAGLGIRSDSRERDFWEVTAGVNYYLGSNGSAGHRAKITVDVTWLPQGSPFGLSQTRIGAADNTDGQNEIMLRAQFQLLI